jgi:hypothetical protein
MLDLFGLPDNAEHQQTFGFVGGTYAGSGSATAVFQPWNKPRGISMVHILALTSGAGGGGGCSGATATQRGGGGSGCAGPFSNLLIPAFVLPDTLFVFVPAGGNGGAANLGGSVGDYSLVSINPSYEGGNNYGIILRSAASAGFGGNPGTATNGGVAGSGGSVAQYQAMLSYAGQFQGGASAAGSAGHATGSPFSQNPSAWSVFLGPASGGAGCTTGNVDSAGGGLNGVGTTTPWVMPWNVNGFPGGAAGGGNGMNGFTFRSPLIFCGGQGGGSFSAGQGGNGGNGAIGCGGGGGGGGITGGIGGAGGPGLIVVTCW